MVLVLTRTYFPEGTNGKLVHEGKITCHTIELPWKDNLSQVSCIPEGEYFLEKRYSSRFGWHLEVLNVPNRSLILFHPANNALKELRGCIAPVSQHSGFGLGLQSKQAFRKLQTVVYPELDAKESILLIVQS
ncbi:DUF5675 family protein [Flavobacterium granuli]|uniref:DUF5675 domain-containing protein n=1 Tax=Flavobacterium granuli TaxID=280093 RepID=A0A1M5U1M0_9FLAO|nr:DUF5675 family protein [Flavobacterium granuli]PRZ19584.1 hypothetical protein BC624_1153 [Flavobacterium granuli]SHH56879.1 hypothetical protein SAMN05443373_1173 [Flavobacterium granuli]